MDLRSAAAETARQLVAGEKGILAAWRGKAENVPPAQQVFCRRTRVNSLARRGKYSPANCFSRIYSARRRRRRAFCPLCPTHPLPSVARSTRSWSGMFRTR